MSYYFSFLTLPPGGGHSTHILVGMCHGEVKNVGLWSGLSVKMLDSGAGLSGLEREKVGLWRGLQREIGGLRDSILAHYNPGALAERFAFGLAAVRPLSHYTNLNKQCAELGVLILLRDFLNNFLVLLDDS